MKTLAIVIAVLACSALAKESMVNLAAKDPHVLQALFSTFQHDNDRHYTSAVEARMRLKNFKTFVSRMAAANDEDDGVEYGVTFFADLTEAEARQYYGFGNKTAAADEADVEEEPAVEGDLQWGGSKDWKGGYNVAKQQGNCGSCWAFTTVGMLEGWAFIRTRRKYSFSEQQVLDCSGRGNDCTGGWYYEALNYIKHYNHLAGPEYRYTQRQGSCRRNSYKNALPFRISGYYKARGDQGIVNAIKKGPLGVAMDFRNINFQGYWKGIWSNTNCKQWPDHAVTLTGYAAGHWEIRNSWGSGWGERGYLKITRKVQNVCMIASNAYYITTAAAGEEEE